MAARSCPPFCASLGNRFSSVQPGVARTANRPPSATMLVDEQYVAQTVLRADIQQQWRVPVLFQNNGCKQRCLQAMRAVVVDDAAKGPHRFQVVVRHGAQIILHPCRRSQSPDQPAFRGGECERFLRQHFLRRLFLQHPCLRSIQVRDSQLYCSLTASPRGTSPPIRGIVRIDRTPRYF